MSNHLHFAFCYLRYLSVASRCLSFVVQRLRCLICLPLAARRLLGAVILKHVLFRNQKTHRFTNQNGFHSIVFLCRRLCLLFAALPICSSLPGKYYRSYPHADARARTLSPHLLLSSLPALIV